MINLLKPLDGVCMFYAPCIRFLLNIISITIAQYHNLATLIIVQKDNKTEKHYKPACEKASFTNV